MSTTSSPGTFSSVRQKPVPRKSALKVALIITLCALALIAFRVSRDSQTALAEGDLLAEAEDHRGAIDAWRRAAAMHLPLLPSSHTAVSRLMDHAAAAESEGRISEALSAYRAVHAASLSARSFYVPYEAQRAEADEAIARLESSSTGAGAETRLAALSAPSAPSLFFFLANLSFVAAVALTFVFIRRVNRDDELPSRTKQALLAGIAVLVLLCLFGLLQA